MGLAHPRARGLSTVGEEGGQLPSLRSAVSGQLIKRIDFNFLYLHGPVPDVATLLEIPTVEV